MQDGGREKSITSREADPTPSLAMLQVEGGHMWGCSKTPIQPEAEARQIPQVAPHEALVPAARTPPLHARAWGILGVREQLCHKPPRLCRLSAPGRPAAHPKHRVSLAQPSASSCFQSCKEMTAVQMQPIKPEKSQAKHTQGA